MIDFLQIKKNRKNIAIAMPLFFIFLLIGINYNVNVYDEGGIVFSAVNVLQGKIPYLDFWTMYAPGQFYLFAAVFSIFGKSLLVERVFSVLLMTLLLTSMLVFSEKIVKFKYAVVSTVIFGIYLGGFSFYYSPVIPALLFAVISLNFLSHYFIKKKFYEILICGIFAALTVIFRHDIGIYTIIAHLVSLIIFLIVDKKWNILKKIILLIKGFLLFLLGCSIILLPVFFYFKNKIPFDIIWNDLIIFPTQIFPKFRSLPYPPPLFNPLDMFNGKITLFQFLKSGAVGVQYYLPFVMFILGVIFLIKSFIKKEKNPVVIFIVTNILILTILYFNQARIRSDLAHLLPVQMLTFLIFPLVYANIIRKFKNHFLNDFLNIFTFVTLSIFLFLPFAEKIQNTYRAYFSMSSETLKTPFSNYIIVEKSFDYYDDVANFINKNTNPDEFIFIGDARHDQLIGNDMLLYFLSDRQSATKYYELHPGLVTTYKIQQEIISDLIHKNVSFIVLNNSQQQLEPNMSSVSSGVFDLDNFIRTNYDNFQNINDYSFWKKKEGAFVY